MVSIYSFFRFWAGPLAMVQRLPLLILFAVGAMLLYPFVWLRVGHWVFYQYLRGVISFLLWVNGVRVSMDKEKLSALEPGFFVVNYAHFVELLILFKVFSYRKLILMDDAFFSMRFFSAVLMNLGIAPQDNRVSMKEFQSKVFSYEAYVQAGFSVIDCVDMQYQRDEVVPNVMALSLRYKKPVHCFKFSGTNAVAYASFLTPVTLNFSYVDTVAVNRRPELCLLNYDRVKFSYLK